MTSSRVVRSGTNMEQASACIITQEYFRMFSTRSSRLVREKRFRAASNNARYRSCIAESSMLAIVWPRWGTLANGSVPEAAPPLPVPAEHRGETGLLVGDDFVEIFLEGGVGGGDAA